MADAFDRVLKGVLAALRGRGLAVSGVEPGAGGELRLTARSPWPHLRFEDASEKAPAGPCAPFGALRLVAVPRTDGAPVPARVLHVARAVVAEQWSALGAWLLPRESPFVRGQVAWDDWRCEQVSASSVGLVLELRGSQGSLVARFDADGALLALDSARCEASAQAVAQVGRMLAFVGRRGSACHAAWLQPRTPAPPVVEAPRSPEPHRPLEPTPPAVPQPPTPPQPELRAVADEPPRPVTPWPIGVSPRVGCEPLPPLVPAWRRHPWRLAPTEARVVLVTALDEASLQTLRRPPFPSLGPARLAGYLQARGVRQVQHVELGLVLETWLRETGQTLDLAPFADADAVADYLERSVPGPVQIATDFLLDRLRLPPADVYGWSLVRQSDDHRQTELLLAQDLCLVHGQRLRQPASVTALGGMNYVTLQTVRDSQLGLLRRCPSLDFVVEGQGDVALHNILRAVFEGLEFADLGQPCEASGAQFRLYPGPGAPANAVGPARPNRRKQDPPLAGGYPLSAYQRLPEAAPAFVNAADYRLTGAEIAERYAFPAALRHELGAHLDRTILPLTLQFIKGCSGICAFCAAGHVKPQALPVAEVVRQVQELRDRYETTHFVFLNNALNWSYRYALDLGQALSRARTGILWTDSLKLTALDERLVATLHDSGMVRVDVGVEVASQRLRTSVRKPLTGERVAEKLELLGRYGIWCDINVIVGFPGEDQSDIDATVRFLRETAAHYMACTVNPYRLIDVSPMGTSPEAFGLSVRPGRQMAGCGWRVAFDEDGATPFEARDAWGLRVSDELVALVSSLGTPPYCSTSNTVPYHLAFLLYEAFGRDGGGRVRQVFGDLLRGLEAWQGGEPRPVLGPLAPHDTCLR